MAASEQEQIILIVKEALFNPGTAVPRICLDEAREAWQARAVPELLSQAGFSIIRTAELERLQRPGKTRIGALRGANEDRTRTAADRDVRLASKVLDALGNRCAAPQRRVAEARIRNPGASWAQLAAGLIEHGDRECPSCGALPGEWCTLLHDKRVALQPFGRSHPERAGFRAAADARDVAATNQSESA